jgi:hypothetical protein
MQAAAARQLGIAEIPVMAGTGRAAAGEGDARGVSRRRFE